MKLLRWRIAMRSLSLGLVTFVIAVMVMGPVAACDVAGDQRAAGDAGDVRSATADVRSATADAPPLQDDADALPTGLPVQAAPKQVGPTLGPSATPPTEPSPTPTRPPSSQARPPTPTPTAFQVWKPAPLCAPECASAVVKTAYGRSLSCTDCDLAFADGVYRLVDLNAVARAIGRDPDDLSNLLWSGGTLANALKQEQADLALVRDVVDAERYRALSNSEYLGEDRPELCCEGDCCPSSCVDSECSCVKACTQPSRYGPRR